MTPPLKKRFSTYEEFLPLSQPDTARPRCTSLLTQLFSLRTKTYSSRPWMGLHIRNQPRTSLSRHDTNCLLLDVLNLSLFGFPDLFLGQESAPSSIFQPLFRKRSASTSIEPLHYAFLDADLDHEAPLTSLEMKKRSHKKL